MPAQRGTALGRVVMSVVTPGRFRDGGRMRKPLTKTETLHVVKDPRDVAPQKVHGYTVDCEIVLRTKRRTRTCCAFGSQGR